MTQSTHAPARKRSSSKRATGNHYHVILSGNRRDPLFSTVHDRRALNQIAFDVMRRYDATLHAYCLMPNHFRVLMQIQDRLLIRSLRRIATVYSRHKQRDLKSPLHLFERPYKAERVDTGTQFLQLLRHIHLSPVITNRVVAPADYLWSSHRAYLGYPSVARVTTEFGLSLLAADPARARVAYHQYIAEGIAADVGCVVEGENEIPTSNERRGSLISSRPGETTMPMHAIDPPAAISTAKSVSLAARLTRRRNKKSLRKYFAVY